MTTNTTNETNSKSNKNTEIKRPNEDVSVELTISNKQIKNVKTTVEPKKDNKPVFEVIGDSESKETKPVSKEIVLPSNYKSVVEQAKKDMKGGSKKTEAAEIVYDELKDCERKVILMAFIEGVGLTKSGSATYLTNIRRRLKQADKK